MRQVLLLAVPSILLNEAVVLSVGHEPLHALLEVEAELDVRAEETGMVRLDDRHAVLVVLQVDVPEVRVVASELLAHGVPYVLQLFYGGVEGSVRGMAVQDLVTVGGRH